MPIEVEWMAEHGLAGRPEDHPDEVWDAVEANKVAARISLDVGWYHPVTAVAAGLPVLATVPGTSPVPLPAGMYEI